VYELKRGKIELIYKGSSGKIQNNVKMKHRNGGLYDRIVKRSSIWENIKKKNHGNKN